MAIGTAAAIGLGVAGIGSAIGASSSSKAAGKAADTSLAVAQQNNALAREIYGQNKDILNPFVQRGNKAGDAINALLGLGGNEQAGPNQAQLPGYQPNALSQFAGFNPQTSDFSRYSDNSINGAPFAGFNPVGGNGFGFQNAPQAGVQQEPAISAQQAQENAFDVFKRSTGYQSRLKEGQDALRSRFVSRGIGQSGAAVKAALRENQNFASNEFGNYVGYLGNQQGVGLAGGSALAGVGQNYVNNVSANNNSAGTAAANAQLVKGQNNPFASLFGTVGGFASSFGR